MALIRQRRFIAPLSAIYKVACFLVLVGQCVYLSSIYFKYTVYYKFAPASPKELEVPKFSLCIPTPIAFEKTWDFFTTNEDVAAGKTLGYLYSLFPPTNVTISRCGYRDFQTDSMVKYDRKKCNEFFEMKMYRLFGYICYRFIPIPHKYTLFSVVSTFTEPRVLYDAVIDKSLDSGFKILPMLHQTDYPTEDRMWDLELLPSNSENESYTLSQIVYEMHRLPSPYESNCGDESYNYCVLDCHHSYFALWGLSPVGNLPQKDDTSLFYPSAKMLYKGKTLQEIYDLYDPFCRSKCLNKQRCEEIIVKTIISSPNTSPEKLVFKIETISQPITLSRVEASFELIDLIFTCTSVASVWLGFSILGLFNIARTCVTQDTRNKRLRWMIQKCKKTLMIKKQIETAMRERLLFIDQRLAHGPPSRQTANDNRHHVRKRLLTISSYATKAIVIVLFTLQVYTIFQRYFQYKTRTELTFNVNPWIEEAPAVAICIPFQVIAGRSDAPTMTRSNYNDVFKQLDASLKISAKEMFNMSWRGDEVIDRCRYRRTGNQSWIHQLHTHRECSDIFVAKRFFFDRKICYSYHFQKRHSMLQFHFKLLVSDPGIFFSIIPSKRALEAEKLVIILFSDSEKLPIESKDFAAVVYRTRTSRLFLLSLYLHEKTLLRHPYENACNPKITRGSCLRHCHIRNTVEKLNRLPYSEIFTEDEASNDFDGLRTLTYSDLNNSINMDIWSNIEKHCSEACNFDRCNSSVIKTIVNFGYRSKYKVELAVDAHANPDMKTNTFPLMTLSDLLYQFFCSASFWLAFTVLSMNPIKIFTQRSTSHQEYLFKKLTRVMRVISRVQQCIICINSSFGLRLLRGTTATRKGTKRNWDNYIHWLIRKDVSKYYYILEVLCIIGCIVHLYQAIYMYLKYPVVMNVFNNPESRDARRRDFSICLDTRCLLFNNKSLQTSQRWTDYESDFPEISIKKIFDSTPEAKDLLVACGFRGLRYSQHKQLTDRVYFVENINHKACTSIYESTKFLLQRFTCFKYSQEHIVNTSSVDENHLFNDQRQILTLIINSSYVTPEFTVAVSDSGYAPAYSSVWSPIIAKKGASIWMAFSYIKITREVLLPPYGNDGFYDSSLLICLSECLTHLLHPYGVMNPGIIFNPPNDSLRFITSRDIKQPIIQSIYRSLEDTCKNECYNKNMHEKSKFSTFITLLDEWKWVDKKEPQFVNRTQFHLTSTEYPVITVKYRAMLPLVEFIITIGNIFSVWFGFAAIHLDPLYFIRQNTNISPDQLSACEMQLEMVSKAIFQLYYFFFASEH